MKNGKNIIIIVIIFCKGLGVSAKEYDDNDDDKGGL